ncbi:hypothetical protein C8E83_1894 [Frondihabitans australicus]|uniref:Uncharacterized protein n=1 Tax=Frondihabitans australicus TaxID=386892 RepID=A0A495II32_9MICO|nr:hypothetical protein C8E83_1894 [Frondihabitans australicus]
MTVSYDDGRLNSLYGEFKRKASQRSVRQFVIRAWSVILCASENASRRE